MLIKKKKNKLYFFKIFIILTGFFPKMLMRVFSFFKFLFFYYYSSTLIENLIQIKFLFLTGLFIFKIFILPVLNVLVSFLNFLIYFKIPEIILVIDLFLATYGYIFSQIVFFVKFYRKIKSYNFSKICNFLWSFLYNFIKNKLYQVFLKFNILETNKLKTFYLLQQSTNAFYIFSLWSIRLSFCYYLKNSLKVLAIAKLSQYSKLIKL